MPRALVLLVLVVATPFASAATFDLGAGKTIERALDPGTSIAFEMPLIVNQDGVLYGKVLATPGNAVNDGSKANGSVSDASGWRVSFAMRLANGERIEMGTFVDSTTSELVPVTIGDKPTFLATVHVPADAARGGPQQKVYVAVAYRLNSAASVGGASGASIDEARALTLVLSNALLPPATADPGVAAPSPDGTSTSIDTDADPDEANIAPVGPIATGRSGAVTVSVAPLPTWFLAGILVVGLVLALALAVMSLAVLSLARAVAERAPGGAAAAREVPVESGRSAADKRAHVEISAPEE